ncbi:hypothetical protein D3C71_1983140 [compost metagenome]
MVPSCAYKEVSNCAKVSGSSLMSFKYCALTLTVNSGATPARVVTLPSLSIDFIPSTDTFTLNVLNVPFRFAS